MPKHHEFTLEINITTTGGFLSVDIFPLEIDGAVSYDEALVNQPETLELIKSAVFNVLRNLTFKGVD